MISNLYKLRLAKWKSNFRKSEQGVKSPQGD
ncbi:hypothetical protein QE320_gp161 [Pseudomonas phage EM]|uniref:Uncharacterized protein n=1 Tax=Pseudomonas phage EM TaxID=2936914 RepID=A0AAE9HI83_9CAUD|nr:hypothetical protein QE320_gp161 [Pseudomonas phage EM]UPW35893.1 hypothetical protein EM_108 [Pseudomonas phage EM]